MAEREIQSPCSLKADVWKYFGFYEVEGEKELDKSHTICKLCRTKLKYFGNTTNIRSHITRFHPEEEKHSAVPVVAASANDHRGPLSKQYCQSFHLAWKGQSELHNQSQLLLPRICVRIQSLRTRAFALCCTLKSRDSTSHLRDILWTQRSPHSTTRPKPKSWNH